MFRIKSHPWPAFKCFVSPLVMPDTSKVCLLQITVSIVAWRWETDPGTRITEDRHCPQAHTSLSLKFINYSLYSPSTSGYFLLSTCNLEDIVLYLWEWPVSNPQRSQWLSTQSSSDRYFHLQGHTVVLLFDHRIRQRAESTAQFKQTCTPQRTCTCGDVFIITAMLSVWPDKNHYAEQRTRRFGQECCSNLFPFQQSR